MALRDKYNQAIQTAKGFGMQGSADERDGKLHFHGTVQTQDQANKLKALAKSVLMLLEVRRSPGSET